MDKAPLSRRRSTPACLVELERVRSEMQSIESTCSNRLGVSGKVVERLTSLLVSPPMYIFVRVPVDYRPFTLTSRGVLAVAHGIRACLFSRRALLIEISRFRSLDTIYLYAHDNIFRILHQSIGRIMSSMMSFACVYTSHSSTTISGVHSIPSKLNAFPFISTRRCACT